MTHRLAGAVLVACSLFALGGVAAAEAPPGPRLAFVQGTDAKLEIVSSDPLGGTPLVLFGGNRRTQPLPFQFSPPTWSGDGSRLAFSGYSDNGDESSLSIYFAAADGSGLTKVAGTRRGFLPVLSPDGRTVAFARERMREARRPGRGETTVLRTASIWLKDLAGGAPRQLTPWRNGLLQYPSSFSPDGSALAITREQRRDEGAGRYTALALRLNGSGASVLAKNASDPVYSPDGTRLALISMGKRKTVRSGNRDASATYTETELAVASADGSGLTKLTKTQGIALAPSWDPSGQRLAYTHLPIDPFASFIQGGTSIMQINADGSCRSRLFFDPEVFLFGAAWQPGPARGAGPIPC